MQPSAGKIVEKRVISFNLHAFAKAHACERQVRLLGWVRFREATGNGAWLEEAAQRMQQAQPEGAVRITSCSINRWEPRHPHARKP